jgi:hypothetical protein
MGHKKHIKRGSLPVSIITSERTPENDYGVMSDPDENNMSATPVPLLTPQQDQPEPHPGPQPQEQETNAIYHEEHHNQSESSHSPQQPPSSQPSSQPSSPSLQSHTPETPLTPQMSLQRQPQPSKSLTALQLKLTNDKNFSRKITTHTFFSYIILALEIERASSASIARISPADTEHLIEYMIEHHTETDAVRIYLQTLVDTGVIRSLIEAIIEFNKDQTEAFNKLLTTEQIELEMVSLQENAKMTKGRITPTSTSTSTSTSTPTPAPNGSPQTPQESLATRFRNFVKRCCCCCHRRRRQSQQPQQPEEEEKPMTEMKKNEAERTMDP